MTDRPLALITGASSGIGLELARRFAMHGYDLVIAADDSAIEAAAPELRTAGPDTVQVETLKLDLSETDGVQRFCSSLGGRVPDAAALNAGFGLGGAFAETDLATAFKPGTFLARARTVISPDLFERVHQAGLDRGIAEDHLVEPMAVLSRLVLHTGRDLDQLTPADLLAFHSWGLRRTSGRKPYGLHLAWELLSILGVTEVGSRLRNAALRGQQTTRETRRGLRKSERPDPRTHHPLSR